MKRQPLPRARSPRRGKPAAKKAASIPAPAARPGPQSAPAAPPPIPAAAQPAPAPLPPAARSPAKRRLPGRAVGEQPGECLRGSVTQIGAQYNTVSNAVRLRLWVEDYNTITLEADYACSRAASITLSAALKEFTRFPDLGRFSADFPNCAQASCRRFSRQEMANGGDVDEALHFRLLPDRNLIQLSGWFSDFDNNGVRYSVIVYLTRTEAEALLHDLERGVADYEVYGGIER